jgi:hypothetical protein
MSFGQPFQQWWGSSHSRILWLTAKISQEKQSSKKWSENEQFFYGFWSVHFLYKKAYFSVASAKLALEGERSCGSWMMCGDGVYRQWRVLPH